MERRIAIGGKGWGITLLAIEVIDIPKVNKIIQYGLEKEVNDLVIAGFSQDEIASHLRQTHPEISDLNALSA